MSSWWAQDQRRGMLKEEFFAWCGHRGLHENRQIGAAFSLSAQTIGNWRKAESLPPWIDLACEGYDIAIRAASGPFPTFPRMTVGYFGEWQRTNGLRSEERRVGKGGVSPGRSRWWPLQSKK